MILITWHLIEFCSRCSIISECVVQILLRECMNTRMNKIILKTFLIDFFLEIFCFSLAIHVISGLCCPNIYKTSFVLQMTNKSFCQQSVGWSYLQFTRSTLVGTLNRLLHSKWKCINMNNKYITNYNMKDAGQDQMAKDPWLAHTHGSFITHIISYCWWKLPIYDAQPNLPSNSFVSHESWLIN